MENILFELTRELKSIVCGECEGGSYNCFTCNVGERIKELLEGHNTNKKVVE